MHFIKTSPRYFQVTLLAAAALASVPAAAASQCKGMQQDACGARAECAWVNGYVRKDGRSVSSHCKKSAREKSADRTTSPAVKLSHAK